MLFLRFSIAILATVIAYFFIFLTIQATFDSPRIRKISESNINDLRNLSTFIANFKKQTNKQPDIKVLNTWGKKQNNQIFNSFGESIVYYDPPIDTHIFGSGPDDGFTLCFWYDPTICVQSWRLDVDSGFIPEEEWFILGSKMKSLIVFFLSSLFFGTLSFYQFKRAFNN
ncbi:hypothetical protein [Methylotenera sp.]|uniref:hypothetical protein n=1 Tax=Methylotenera sp. TaxID=2051956 RepID=UPI0027376224|nr:hypothetical protein [Methylotenera sp.]MDP3777644.1 hypothetical protein [Methylotenera sp.]